MLVVELMSKGDLSKYLRGKRARFIVMFVNKLDVVLPVIVMKLSQLWKRRYSVTVNRFHVVWTICQKEATFTEIWQLGTFY